MSRTLKVIRDRGLNVEGTLGVAKSYVMEQGETGPQEGPQRHVTMDANSIACPFMNKNS